MDAPYRVEIPYWFSGHNVKGQGQTAGLHPKRCLFNISWPFVWWSNLLPWLTLKRSSLVTRSRSNYWSSFQHYLLNILWAICLIITKLGTVVATIVGTHGWLRFVPFPSWREERSVISRGFRRWVATREWIIHCICTTLLTFCDLVYINRNQSLYPMYKIWSPYSNWG